MARIQFTNVDLEYPVRENQSVTLKEFVLHGLFRPTKNRVKSIKALSNLNFEMRDGDRIGVIGLNGAGKSTLLRTIGGVYPIERGERIVQGNICSLYEIQVGFDREATGRENIYYRSYLQGETPKTIKQNLKQIEDFSELGHFLQLPIRCYSAGMLMRLAFSIATARHPEILLIDEIFAAGDLIFQKKAEERMHDFMHKARIVVMVGHELPFLEKFCNRVMWLNKGQILAMGPPADVIRAYKAEAAKLQAEAVAASRAA